MVPLEPKRTEKNEGANAFLIPGFLNGLERRFWRNWILFLGVTIVTTTGLVTALRPVLTEQFLNFWPWAGTEYVLLTSISVLVTGFAVYLSHQQRQIAVVRRRFYRLQEQTNERTRRHYTRLLALFNVSRLAGTDTDLQNLFDSVTNMCVEAFECEQASLMFSNKKTSELEVESATGHINIAEVMGTRRKVGEGVAGWVAEHREPLLIVPDMDARKYPGLVLKDRALSTAMVVPIIVRNKLIGILNVSSRTPGFRYDQEDLRTLQIFAENVGTYIRHTAHADWMRKTNRELREALARRNAQDPCVPSFSTDGS